LFTRFLNKTNLKQDDKHRVDTIFKGFIENFEKWAYYNDIHGEQQEEDEKAPDQPADDQKDEPATPPTPPSPVRTPSPGLSISSDAISSDDDRLLTRPALPNAPHADPLAAIPMAAPGAEAAAWNQFVTIARPVNDPVRRIINAGLHQQYYQYNPFVGAIEAVPVRASRRRSRLSDRGKVSFHENLRFAFHPERRQQEVARQKAANSDTWAAAHRNAQVAQIGEFINLEILPAVLYINIRRSVQVAALKIIAKRIMEHARGRDTRLLLKKSLRTGKYQYKGWVGTKELARMTKENLFTRLLTATNQRRRGVSIIVRQKIARGRLHDLWNKKHSLL
jgi:hypothetical protein